MKTIIDDFYIKAESNPNAITVGGRNTITVHNKQPIPVIFGIPKDKSDIRVQIEANSYQWIFASDDDEREKFIAALENGDYLVKNGKLVNTSI